MNILLIDDEEICGELARESIKHEYPNSTLMQVLDCASGKKQLSEGCFDALILDLNLKGHDGAECLRELRAQWPNLPVVILTGHWSEERRKECLDAGADYYVIKESVNQLLGMAVTTAIEKRRITEEGESFICERRGKLDKLREQLNLGKTTNGRDS